MDSKNHLLEMINGLSEANIRFIVAGGVALVLHGIERMTIDLDIAVDFEQENINSFIECINQWNLTPRAPISIEILKDREKLTSLFKTKKALVFTLIDTDNPFKQIDVFISPEMSYENLINNAHEIPIGSKKIAVVSPEKLLELKENIEDPRDKDIFDINALKKLINKNG